jgi:hypothetical protein
MVNFYKFQEHRRSCLPNVLQGRNSQPPGTQQAEDKISMGANPRKKRLRTRQRKLKSQIRKKRSPTKKKETQR